MKQLLYAAARLAQAVEQQLQEHPDESLQCLLDNLHKELRRFNQPLTYEEGCQAYTEQNRVFQPFIDYYRPSDSVQLQVMPGPYERLNTAQDGNVHLYYDLAHRCIGARVQGLQTLLDIIKKSTEIKKE